MDCQLKIYALHLLYIGENFRNFLFILFLLIIKM